MSVQFFCSFSALSAGSSSGNRSFLWFSEHSLLLYDLRFYSRTEYEP